MRAHCRAALTMSPHRPHRPEPRPHPSHKARTPADPRHQARPHRGGSAADDRTVAGLGAWVEGAEADGEFRCGSLKTEMNLQNCPYLVCQQRNKI
jgi:hypothetical protein